MSMRGHDLIRAERIRQEMSEHYTRAGDVGRAHELAQAAAAYALDGILDTTGLFPWDEKYWKPKDARRNLIRAGALIAAAIDALEEADE